MNEIGSALMGNDWALVASNDRMQVVQKYLARRPALLIWDNFEAIIQGTDQLFVFLSKKSVELWSNHRIRKIFIPIKFCAVKIFIEIRNHLE